MTFSISSLLHFKDIKSMLFLNLANFEKGVTLKRMSNNKNVYLNITIGAKLQTRLSRNDGFTNTTVLHWSNDI